MPGRQAPRFKRNPGQASGGSSFLFHGFNGSGGANSSDVNVNFVGAGNTFQVDANNAFGIDAQSHGQQGGNGIGVIPPFGGVGIGGSGGGGGNGGNVNVSVTGTGLISTIGDNQHAIFGLSAGGPAAMAATGSRLSGLSGKAAMAPMAAPRNR